MVRVVIMHNGNVSWPIWRKMFGRGSREDLDDDEARELANRLRDAIKTEVEIGSKTSKLWYWDSRNGRHVPHWSMHLAIWPLWSAPTQLYHWRRLHTLATANLISMATALSFGSVIRCVIEYRVKLTAKYKKSEEDSATQW